MKINKLLEKIIGVFFIVLLLAIVAANLYKFRFDNSTIFIASLMFMILTVIFLFLYKKKIISKKILIIIFFTYFIIGVIIRIYFIENINLVLNSDFELYYNTAVEINNNNLSSGEYLSFNGYVYVFSYFLSIIFVIFGTSIKVIFYLNLVIQILSAYVLYKIIKMKFSTVTAALIATTYFLIPTIIFSTLLVSTETTFFLFMFICILLFYKIKDKKTYNYKNMLLYIIFGITLSVANNIRPVMSVFLIAIAIYYILKMEKFKEILFLAIIIFAYAITNFGFEAFIEKGIDTKIRSGALGWSFYFGANYESCGAWTLEDSGYVFTLLDDDKIGNKELIIQSLKRWNNLGMIKSTELLICKYTTLWTNNISSYNYVKLNEIKTDINFSKYEQPFARISTVLIIIISITSLISTCIEIKNKKEQWLFIELFCVGYILSNLLVCLNTRYNMPIYPILLICSTPIIEIVFQPNNLIKKRPMNLTCDRVAKNN